jgi:hypothetical protein
MFPPAEKKYAFRTPLFLTAILVSCLSFAALSVPAQRALSASKERLEIEGFTFRIARVAFDDTAMGFVPVEMSTDDRVMFVEFELMEGSKESFKSLEITISCGSGRKSKAFLLTSDGIMKMLATVILKSSKTSYEPKKENIALVYVVPKRADKLQLNFPTGEIIDLNPLKK